MSLSIKTGFPDGVTISPGYVVRFAAQDPTTGADVNGVKISNASVFVANMGIMELEPAQPYQWVPNASAGAV